MPGGKVGGNNMNSHCLQCRFEKGDNSMKTNIRTFPKPKAANLGVGVCYEFPEVGDYQAWKEHFEKELRKRRAKHQKDWDKMGLICADLFVDFINEILGETQHHEAK